MVDLTAVNGREKGNISIPHRPALLVNHPSNETERVALHTLHENIIAKRDDTHGIETADLSDGILNTDIVDICCYTEILQVIIDEIDGDAVTGIIDGKQSVGERTVLELLVDGLGCQSLCHQSDE